MLQIRCVDAAREAARLIARGEDGVAVAQQVGPTGAAVSVDRDGGLVVVRVSTQTPMLPGITITAAAIAAAEPGR